MLGKKNHYTEEPLKLLRFNRLYSNNFSFQSANIFRNLQGWLNLWPSCGCVYQKINTRGTREKHKCYPSQYCLRMCVRKLRVGSQINSHLLPLRRYLSPCDDVTLKVPLTPLKAPAAAAPAPKQLSITQRLQQVHAETDVWFIARYQWVFRVTALKARHELSLSWAEGFVSGDSGDTYMNNTWAWNSQVWPPGSLALVAAVRNGVMLSITQELR